MEIFKLNAYDRRVLAKRRLSTVYKVSQYGEHFSCEGAGEVITFFSDRTSGYIFGVSKEERFISRKVSWVNGNWDEVGRGS